MKIIATYTQHDCSSGLEMFPVNDWDLVRIFPTEVQDREITLPPASECPGRRYAFRHSGDAGLAYLNPAEGDLLNGSEATVILEPGQFVTLQSVQNPSGWEQVG